MLRAASLCLLLAACPAGSTSVGDGCPEIPGHRVTESGEGWKLVSSRYGQHVLVEGPRPMTAKEAHQISLTHRDGVRASVRADLNLGSGVRSDLSVPFVQVSAHDFKAGEGLIARDLARLVRAEVKQYCVVFHLQEMKNVLYGPPSTR